MGLCKSRQQKPSYAIPKKMEPTFRAPPGLGQPIRSNLRPDAEPFHPQDAGIYDTVEEDEGVKAEWEAFLEKKMKTQPKALPNRPLVPRTDGSFTSGYHAMLGESKEAKRPPWRKQEPTRDLPPRDFDILTSWRNAAPKVEPQVRRPDGAEEAQDHRAKEADHGTARGRSAEPALDEVC